MEKYLNNLNNWNNHRPLLLWALEKTKKSKLPVLELGCGDGSTDMLREICKKQKRELRSYDFSKEWAEKFKATHVQDWDSVEFKEYSVILIDHSPGERRYIEIQRLAKSAEYIIIHDSEPSATGYQLDKVWHLFPYKRDLKSEGAWASIVSTRNIIPEINIYGYTAV